MTLDWDSTDAFTRLNLKKKGIEFFDAHSKLSAGTNATRVMPLEESTPTKQLSLGSLSFVCVSGEDSEKDYTRIVVPLRKRVLPLR